MYSFNNQSYRKDLFVPFTIVKTTISILNVIRMCSIPAVSVVIDCNRKVTTSHLMAGLLIANTSHSVCFA